VIVQRAEAFVEFAAPKIETRKPRTILRGAIRIGCHVVQKMSMLPSLYSNSVDSRREVILRLPQEGKVGLRNPGEFCSPIARQFNKKPCSLDVCEDGVQYYDVQRWVGRFSAAQVTQGMSNQGCKSERLRRDAGQPQNWHRQ